MVTEQRSFARRLRSNSTQAEQILWRALRGRRLKGMKFRRQVPLSFYTVDFLCLERKLIIEVDGRQHAFDRDYDEERSREREGMGFLLMRFTNEQVTGDIDFVLTQIQSTVFLNSGSG